MAQLRAIADLTTTVPEFDRYGEIIENWINTLKQIPRSMTKKQRSAKKRLSRKIAIKKWKLEVLV